MTPDPLILDACEVLNLAASGRAAEILEANNASALVTVQAADEALWFEDDDGERVGIDIATFASPAPVELITPTEQELLTLVGLAARLGIGEASSLAIGQHRNLRVATDDRLARRTAHTMQPPVEVLSTSAILHAWSASRDRDAVAATLRRIEVGASFVPPRQDPNLSWWTTASRP